MQKRKLITTIIMIFAIAFFSSAIAITINQIPNDMTVGSTGSTCVQTFLPVDVEYTDKCSTTANARLFGLVNVKKVNISLRKPAKVQLCGSIFGIRMYSDGVRVTGVSDFISNGKKVCPAQTAGIKKGDLIKAVNGVKVRSNQEFAKIVQSSSDVLSLTIADENGTEKTKALTPQYSDEDNCLKTGMWVRDSAAGIGTLTYIDPKSRTFGGLGHGICDIDTQDIVPVYSGDIVKALIVDIKRGVKGSAGEIRGYLCSNVIGEIQANTISGTYGKYSSEIDSQKLYDVAFKQEVRTGKAQLLCTLDNKSPRLYDITIDKINYNGAEPTKNMMITVTDKELLRQTGGIVQGMSGSPIIQDGKFIGAVTHVFVNNPESGYAIFAENMVSYGQKISSSN